MELTELARLRRVAGKETTRLTHYGRKTGEPHEVMIWFVLDRNKLYIGTANINRQWVRNVQKMSKIRLSIAGESFDGTARFLTDVLSTTANSLNSRPEPRISTSMNSGLRNRSMLMKYSVMKRFIGWPGVLMTAS